MNYIIWYNVILCLQQTLQECVNQMECGIHPLLLPTTGVQKTLQVSHTPAIRDYLNGLSVFINK